MKRQESKKEYTIGIKKEIECRGSLHILLHVFKPSGFHIGVKKKTADEFRTFQNTA